MENEEHISPSNLVWGGNTETDQRRHMQARIHFLNLLCDHLAAQGVFLAWLHSMDLRLPLHNAQLLHGLLAELRQIDESNAQIEAVENQYREAKHEVEQVLSANASMLAAMVAAYVTKELNLDWHWLSAELIRAWMAHVNATMFGAILIEVKIQYIPAKNPPTVPGRYPKGRLRKDQDVARDVEWFFRIHVKHESTRSVSRHAMDGSLLPEGFEYKHSDVKKYANRARTWLSFGFSDQHLIEIVAQLPQGDEAGSTSRLPPTPKP